MPSVVSCAVSSWPTACWNGALLERMNANARTSTKKAAAAIRPAAPVCCGASIPLAVLPVGILHAPVGTIPSLSFRAVLPRGEEAKVGVVA